MPRGLKLGTRSHPMCKGVDFSLSRTAGGEPATHLCCKTGHCENAKGKQSAVELAVSRQYTGGAAVRHALRSRGRG